MATIDATVGGTSSNAYVTTSTADTYFEGRLNVSTWDDATSDDKTRAIISATRRLDQETWEGQKDTEDQALEWPRDDAFDQNGFEYDTDEIPQPIQDATCELALAMLEDDLLDDTGLEGFEEVEIGPMKVIPRHIQQAGELPEHVMREVHHIILSHSGNPRLFRA